MTSMNNNQQTFVLEHFCQLALHNILACRHSEWNILLYGLVISEIVKENGY
jgi:hypothetical protein